MVRPGVIVEDFQRLCRLADEYIGKPRVVIDEKDAFGKLGEKKNSNIRTILKTK